MHVGIDCRLPFYQRGGISQYVIHLMDAVSREPGDHAYTLFHMWKDGDRYGRDLPRANVYTPCHHRLETWTLGLEVARHRPDVLHSPDYIPPRFGAQKNVITIHDLNFIFYPQFLTAESRRYYGGQIEWAVQQADHISADSHHTRQDVINELHVPPEKITTVHLSVHPLYQRPYADDEIAITLKQHNLPRGFILAVGTLEPRKNLPTLLHAYHQLRQETAVDLPLVLVGRRGWLYEEIFQTVDDLALRPYVRHLEGVYDEQLAHLYHAAGVLATPSHYEGFGLPALEALTCGCPVVVSDRGSLPEIAGKHSICLPPDDPAEWAEQLHRVLTDSDLRTKMIRRGRAHAADFSWMEAARKTIEIYETVGRS